MMPDALHFVENNYWRHCFGSNITEIAIKKIILAISKKALRF